MAGSRIVRTLSLGNPSVTAGQVVTVYVSTYGSNEDIYGAYYGIRWDPQYLELDDPLNGFPFSGMVANTVTFGRMILTLSSARRALIPSAVIR